MYKGKTKYVIQIVVIAVLYIILTVIADQFQMAKGIVQIRISDALMILPYFTPAAIPGLFIGCLTSNALISYIEDPMTGKMVLSSAAQYYVIFGSLATLAGSILAYLLRKYKFVVFIPPVIINTIVIPLVFKLAFRFEDSFLKCVLGVGVGELISCGLLGTALLLALEDSKDKLFPSDKKKDEESDDSKEED